MINSINNLLAQLFSFWRLQNQGETPKLNRKKSMQEEFPPLNLGILSFQIIIIVYINKTKKVLNLRQAILCKSWVPKMVMVIIINLRTYH